MQGGFSFCGVDIAKYGLEYVPPLDQTYVFAGSGNEVHQETFEAHDGGYYYGATVQPKDFTLRCIYQDRHLLHGTLATIESFFHRGRTGRLVFQNRDWLWYTATVLGVDVSDIRNYRNGFITITMRAYYPFARHDFISIGSQNILSSHIAANTGLLTAEETPATSFENMTQSTDLFLYNGGSERASAAIAIAGNAGEGVVITNHTTGQTAKFVAFSTDKTTNAGKYVVSDALNGKTVLTDGTNAERGFMYHDHGFIELVPSFPIERDIYVVYEANSNMISISGFELDDDVIGRFIFIEDAWRKITAKTDDTLSIDTAPKSDGEGCTNIVTMNEISVELLGGASLSKLQFIYKPTFQ